MSTKYRLLRDCPQGESGSIWKEVFPFYYPQDGYADGFRRMLKDGSYMTFVFPPDNFSDWFEEAKEMKKFTKEQAREIKKNDIFTGKLLYDWVDANTEK